MCTLVYVCGHVSAQVSEHIWIMIQPKDQVTFFGKGDEPPTRAAAQFKDLVTLLSRQIQPKRDIFRVSAIVNVIEWRKGMLMIKLLHNTP